MFSSFFALLKSSAGLFGSFTPPAARQAPWCFSYVKHHQDFALLFGKSLLDKLILDRTIISMI